MTDRSDPLSAPAYDADTVADLRDLFGPARFVQMLAGLDGEIAYRIESAKHDDPDLGANAHVLVSVSGTLGFLPLSNACALLERACLDGTDTAPPLRAAREAAAGARQAVAELCGGR